MAYAMALNINKSYKSEELNELNRIIDSHKWFILNIRKQPSSSSI